MSRRDADQGKPKRAKAKVKPCPFCGCDVPYFFRYEGRAELGYYICPECDTVGPSSFTKRAALALWNVRVKP